MEKVSFRREIPLRYDVDVFVAGGGPAGVTAAVAAARQGAKVLLIESQGCLGGLGTAGLVPCYMTFGDGEHFLAAGLGEEILHRLWKTGGYEGKFEHSTAIRVEALKRVYDDMMLEAGADFLLGTNLVDAAVKDGKIEYCVVSGKSGVYAVRAKVYIDATGDGDLAVMSGAPYEKGDENGLVMPSTLCSLWAGIDFTKRDMRDDDEASLRKAYADGVFEQLDLHLTGICQQYETTGGGNIGHVYGIDGTDERSLTEGLVKGRRLYDQFEKYYKNYLHGYEHMNLVATGNLMGVRESRRIMGEYKLVLDDYRGQANFNDEIGRYCYGVDIHPANLSWDAFLEFRKQFNEWRLKRGQNYGVPYRILVPQKVDNLLVAGRCISADRYLQASLRVMPGCYITGQAAGVAAAVCVQSNALPRQADVRDIQSRLKNMGMYLPNYHE